jgi:two-component sensor histidine kinase
MTDIHELRSLSDRQQVLMGELQHRTRNLLAVVQAIAAQTLKSVATHSDFKVEFESRLRSLGRVQSLLSRFDRHDVDLRDLVTQELEAHVARDVASKIRAEGPSLALAASAAEAIGLALHELATNAVKYGALGQPLAQLSIEWREENVAGKRRVALEWSESGVAMRSDRPPSRMGYGRELIERALPYQLGAETELTFKTDGIRCRISVPMML